MLVRAAALIFVLSSSTPALAAPPDVHLEVLLADRLRVGEPQRWLRMLQDLPLASVRMRQIRAGETPEIDRKSKTGGPIYVRAILTIKGTLRVPEEQFQFSERRRIQQWIEELQVGDVEPRMAFGLTAKELVAVRRALSKPVLQETKGQSFSQFVADIKSNLNVPLATDPNVGVLPRAAGDVADELRGVSSGTALVSVLRRSGMGLVPKRSSEGSLTLRIVAERAVPEVWPVGWEPEAPARESIPKLFDFLQVEIAPTPLDETLTALQSRLEVPFLLDHNGIARQGIDLSEKRVRFPSKRTFYKRVLDQVLFQALLEAELRTDDAGKPFIWITPIRRSTR